MVILMMLKIPKWSSRTDSMSLTLMPFFLLTALVETQVWLQRPGTVYVCEGDNVSFVWEYEPNIGSLDAWTFYKIKPSRQLLLSAVKGDLHTTHPNWRFLKGRQEDIITLENAELSDNATYEIEINFDKYTKLIYDQAELKVLKNCPDEAHFNQPIITVSYTDRPSQLNISNDVLQIAEPCKVALTVYLPTATPLVTCYIIHDNTNHSCEYTTDKESCKSELSLGKDLIDEVIVVLSFIGLPPSRTLLSFQCNETEHRKAAEGDVSLGVTVLIVFLVLIFSGILTGTTIVLCKRYQQNKIAKSCYPLPVAECHGPNKSMRIRGSPEGQESKRTSEVLDNLLAACRQGEVTSVEESGEPIIEVINTAGHSGETPLGVAVHKGHADLVDYLMKKGADPNILSMTQPLLSQSDGDASPTGGAKKNLIGERLLCMAAAMGHKDVIIKLVAGGANVNKEGTCCLTPLQLASMRGYDKVVQYLHGEGADVDKAARGTHPAWVLAIENQHTRIFHFLAEKRAKRKVNFANKNDWPYNITPRQSTPATQDQKSASGSPFTKMIKYCPYDEPPSVTLSAERMDSPLENIDKGIQIQCSGCQRNVTTGIYSDFHSFHTELEKFLKHSLSTSVFGQIDRTGSFPLNNAIGIVKTLKYRLQLKLSKTQLNIFKASADGLDYEFPLSSTEKANVMQCSRKVIIKKLDTFVGKQLEQEIINKNRVRAWCYPSLYGTDVCINLTWVCPQEHIHDIRVNIVPAIIWEGKRLKEALTLPLVFLKEPFKKDDISKLSVMLVPVENFAIAEAIDECWSTWRLSFETTLPEMFKCFDRLSPNVRRCFRLLKFIRDFLPVRMVYSPDRGYWESSPLISSWVLLNILLQAVANHPAYTEWADGLLEDRLASLLSFLTSETYTNFFTDSEQPSFDLKHLSDSERNGMLKFISTDIKNCIEIINTVYQPSEMSNDLQGTLASASHYVTYDVICVLELDPSGGVPYKVTADWRVPNASKGKPLDMYCYRLPMPNFACEKISEYQNIYKYFLSKFEKSHSLEKENYLGLL